MLAIFYQFIKYFITKDYFYKIFGISIFLLKIIINSL
jgi:hypothetical protein